QRVGRRARDRLLGIDVLAERYGPLEILAAEIRRDRVEIDGVAVVGERCVEIRGCALDAVRAGEFLELIGVAPDQHRFRLDAPAVLEPHPALLAQRQDRADEMLVRPHASGDAIHDDAETLGHGAALCLIDAESGAMEAPASRLKTLPLSPIR